MSGGVLLKNLNPEQLKAVMHTDGSMLVLAGAGSGKTRVLTTRIVWLVKNQQVESDAILAVTFTNKAAKEMKLRVSNQLGMDTKHMWIGTFHSIALRLLGRYHKQAGLPPYFQILDAQDQLNILKRILKGSGLDEDRYSAKELQKFINQQKEAGLRAHQLTTTSLRQQIWAELYGEYEALCNRDNLVDFTELLLRSYETLTQHNDILEKYHNQFQHILIDEFQDTNQLQYRWLQLLGKNCHNMFAVGDDDQSIYSFRGAKVANMQAFLYDFKITDPIRLEQNYRSTTNILEAANAVIDNNSDRIGKKLWTDNLSGEKIHFYEGYTEEDEAYFVVDEIQTLHEGGVKLSDIAILYRSNAQSRVFEQLFYAKGLAYRVYGGLRFFDRQEIKHVLSYLRLLLNSNDNEAFLRVVNVPARGIGAKTIETLQTLATKHEISLFEACPLLEGRSKLCLTKFTDLILNMQKNVSALNLPEIINYIIEVTGLSEMYAQDRKNGRERLENLNELVNAVGNFKTGENEDNSIATFLAHAVLDSADAQADGYEQSVQLMTVHAAKGLEFDTVFVVGLEDGLFPHENCFELKRDMEEERRLMYVAITRARKKLYLLRACSRLMWGKRISAPVSRFINEIPEKLISNISGISTIGYNNLTDSISISDMGHNLTPLQLTNPETKISRIQLVDQDMVVKIGDMITHAKFGKGKIVNLNIDGKKKTAEIFFIGTGKKTLDLNIAKIERI
ncbi:MAG: UvrD-helicase domain-containing protein [Burkholderiales bacterium]|nr:UvrD-helicase domain-containing protein [Burkholderiales bacterium]